MTVTFTRQQTKMAFYLLQHIFVIAYGQNHDAVQKFVAEDSKRNALTSITVQYKNYFRTRTWQT